MHISHIEVRNFRALTDISCDFGDKINVIVGPNAVGKSTILQSIRLVKALIAPRSANETNQVLISLGAASPHFPQRLFLHTIARDKTRAVDIRFNVIVTDAEAGTLRNSVPAIAQSLVAARIGQSFLGTAALIQFLQSPRGRDALAEATQETESALKRLQTNRTLLLGVSLDSQTGSVIAADPLAGVLFGFLDNNLPPSSTLFSYFPADRALPMGEVGLQLGAADAQQQLESHNSQPQLKYTRLKNLIINSLILGDKTTTIKDDFEKIFSGLLRSRTIDSIRLNELGLLEVMTSDKATGSMIELDSLSSGEKNISLTLLLVARTIQNGGIALFDEPELHLNPAVSRDLVSFMMREYCDERDIQFIMCSHSPEILTSAFSNSECQLLHLKSSSDVSPVGKKSLDEYSEAITRLGSSISENMLYEGTAFVEGPTDVEIITFAFPQLFRRLNLRPKGGRNQIEESIKEMQELERSGQAVSNLYFFFDKDDDVSKFRDSARIKIVQWPVRCIENYMIDVDALSELLRSRDYAETPILSSGQVVKLLRELAFRQIDSIAARQQYNSYSYANSSLQKTDVDGDLDEIVQRLYGRMKSARDSLSGQSEAEWTETFRAGVEQKKQEMQRQWEADWASLCDGKRLISDLHKAVQPRRSEAAFKLAIVREMKNQETRNWRDWSALITKAIGG
nr:AAA family ATPase [Mesorhizobium sp.]